MTNSTSISKLLGPSLLVINLSEALNSQIWTNVTAPQTYLAGALWFVAGLSIIRTHNHWSIGWPVLITLVGWFIIFGGLVRMFFPEPMPPSSQSAFVVLAIQLILIAIGIVLTVKAYGPDHSKAVHH